MDGLRNFALEAERQYRRLAEYAESLGVRKVAGQLRDRAAKMRELLEQNPGSAAEGEGRASVLSEAADELYILGEEIHHRLSQWPPGSLGEFQDLVFFVQARSERLSMLLRIEQRAALGGAGDTSGEVGQVTQRRRWGQETPAVLEPPIFPSP